MAGTIDDGELPHATLDGSRLVTTLERDVAREATRRRLFGERGGERRVSRFELLERVGAGSMGTVYAAYDPQLDRRVAVKLLDARGQGRADRLVAEARAMAQVSHPNVVAVYEVGVHDPGPGAEPVVYVAMQFIHGLTLRRWVKLRQPSWREILRCHLDAGRGLAAVHARGLVHRDFKPDNVMVADDGRVAVMDFGLALVDPSRDSTSSSDDTLRPRQDESISGTPGYMAPELFVGIPATERTDQFAFCVALFEGLWGHRPFAGATLDELVMNLELGRVQRPQHAGGVPAAVLRTILRGLELDPARRFPSMDALLGALERAAGRSRRLAITTTLVGLGLVGAFAWSFVPAAPRCDPADKLARVWSADTREPLVETLTRAGDDDLAGRVATRIDDWSTQWTATFVAVCSGGAEWTPALLARAERCLDRRLDALGAALDAISRIDRARRNKALDLVERLPPAASCGDPQSVAADVEPPTNVASAEQVDALRGELDVLQARRATGDYDGADDALAALVVRAEALEYPPLLAEVLLTHGKVQLQLGDATTAIATLERAFFLAAEASHRGTAIDAATELVMAHGSHNRDPDEGLVWERHARAQLASGAPDPAREVAVDVALADLHMHRNNLPQAKALLEQAAIDVEALGAGWNAIDVHITLGFLELRTAELDAAVVSFTRARELVLERFGPHHPNLGHVNIGLATAAHRSGDLDEAVRLTRDAAEIYAAALGPEHLNVAGAMHNLGSLEVAANDHAAARVTLEATLALRERILGPDHIDVASTLGLLAVVYEELGELDRARSVNARALAIATAVYGDDHPLVADLLTNLGTLAMADGDPRGAIARFEAAVEIRLAKQGTTHPDLATMYRNLAQCHLELGELATAKKYAQDEVAIEVATLGEDHDRVAQGRELLAEIDEAGR